MTGKYQVTGCACKLYDNGSIGLCGLHNESIRTYRAENASLVRKVKKLQGKLLVKAREIAQLEGDLLDD